MSLLPGRLDFCALNAGIDDRDDIFKSIRYRQSFKVHMSASITHPFLVLVETQTTHQRYAFSIFRRPFDFMPVSHADAQMLTQMQKPNMQTIDVDLIAPYYGCKLAAHYLSLDSTAAGKPKPGGKIVVTASAAGIYPAPFVPQYGMAKTGLVGLVRAFAPNARQVNITVNAVCPARE